MDVGGYLDPRVKMVVPSYPQTSIERHYTQVTYPDLKFKKQQYTSGYCRVWIQFWTDREGNVTGKGFQILSPKTDGPLDKIFVDQVRREVARWSFDRTAAEINVDVRFHVE